MAWEVWYMPLEDHGYGKLGFFCNTADICFGPVVYVSYSYDVDTVVNAIYDHWDEACREIVDVPIDPRSMTMDDHQIYQVARKCLVMAELEDEEGDA
jgi:hypothetical protein